MRSLALAALLLCMSTAGQAADGAAGYPGKAVKIVLPFPTGATFVIGQTLSEILSKSLGQPVVVENRGGAGGRIAIEYVANAAPDGYTLLLTSPTLTITPALDPKLHFDPASDLASVAMVAQVPNVLVVNPAKFPDEDFKAFEKEVKAHPGKFSFGSGGAGSSNHLAFERFKSLTHTDILHVPYQGASQAVMAAVGGQIDMAINGLPSSVPLIKGGQLKAVFVLTRARQPLLPDTPSAEEVGLPDMAITTWYGVVAPKGTPPAIVAKLAAAIERGLSTDDMRKRLAAAGIDYVYQGPDEFKRFIAGDFETWRKVVKEAHIDINAQN